MNLIIKSTDSANSKLVVGLYQDQRYYNVKEIMSKSTLSNSIYIDSSDTLEIPFLVPESDDTMNNLDVTPLYTAIVSSSYSLTVEQVKKFSTILRQHLGIENNDPFLNEEQIRILEKVFSEYDSYMSGNTVHINMSPVWIGGENYTRTKELIQKINDSGKTESIYIEGENKTLYRKGEEDELFISVPTYTELSIEDVKLPNPSTIEEPYSKYIKSKALSTTDEKVLIEKLLSPRYREVSQNIVPLAEIIGSSENNELPIQVSEMRFYNALKSLMDVGIEKENPDISLEDCVAMNKGSLIVKDYITNLILMGALINWSHTGLLPYNLLYDLCESSDSTDDDIDVESSDSTDDSNNQPEGLLGRNEYNADFISSSNPRFGDRDLISLIDACFNKNIYSIIDIAIRMFRFGSQKPTRIPLPDGDWYDLNTFIKSSNSGNFRMTEIEEFEDGSNLMPIGVVKLTDFISDKSYLKSKHIQEASADIPIGLCCKRQFKSSDVNQRVFISFIDLIEALDSKEPLCKVSGISIKNGEIVVSPEVSSCWSDDTTIQLRDVVKQINNSSDSLIDYYQYSGIQDAFMEKNAFDKKTGVLSIVNEYFSESDLSILDTFSYSTVEELDNNIETFSQPAKVFIKANVARFVLPIICKANDRYISDTLKGMKPSLEYIINLYKGTMDSLGFTGDFSGIDKLGGEVSNNTDLEKSTSFNNVSINNKDEGDYYVDKLICNELNGQEICAVIMKKDIYDILVSSGETVNNLGVMNIKVRVPGMAEPQVVKSILVGYIAMPPADNRNLFRVLLDPNMPRPQFKKSMDIMKLTKVLSSNMSKLINKGEPIFKFSDPATGDYYLNLLDKAISVVSKR